MRSEDSSLKTQIRFLKDDVGLFTKCKGTDEPFTRMEMDENDFTEKLPEIDVNATWRRTSLNHREIKVKSLAVQKEDQAQKSSNKKVHDRVRQRDSSRSPDRFQRKESKKVLSADSSKSDSSSVTSSDTYNSKDVSKQSVKSMHTSD